jgi:predicted NUDIX family phosphoesterase
LEEILVVPREHLMNKPVHGFALGPSEYMSQIDRHGSFRRREQVEDDPSFKQIIPYLIVRHTDRLFLFQRSAGGNEERLRGLFSIGVGGHINRGDVVGATDLVAAGLRRELDEELVIHGAWRARLVGVLNDDSNAVGRVHFGLVHVVDVESPDVAIRESEALTGRMASREDVLAVRDQMETWSRLILESTDPLSL